MDKKQNKPEKEQIVAEKLRAKNHHIAFAESCTGGMAAARLINVPSASEVINESIVTYSNEAKIKYLHVPEELIARYGVVSEEVAGAMAAGMAAAAGSETAVGISGIAGPTGAVPGKPVGMVCFGFFVDGTIVTDTVRFGEIGRNAVRAASVEFVYDRLLALL